MSKNKLLYHADDDDDIYIYSMIYDGFVSVLSFNPKLQSCKQKLLVVLDKE